MTTPTDRLIGALREQNCEPRPCAGGWSARCPAHADENPSLSVSAGDDGRALVCCHAGCETLDVLRALGLSKTDLFECDDGARRNGRPPKSKRAARDFDELASKCAARLDGDALDELAERLGVRADALRALDFGLAPDGAFTWPERDGAGVVVGVGTRTDAGAKKCIPGSRRGLIYNADAPPSDAPLIVCEGASDTAAALTLRLPAIGLAQAGGSRDARAWLVDYIHRLAAPAVIVVADTDDAGERGGARVADYLAARIDAPVYLAPTPGGAADLRAMLADAVEDGLSLDDAEACQRAGTDALAELVRAPVVVAEPDDDDDDDDDKSSGRRAQADLIVDLAANLDVFHAPGDDGAAYATIDADGRMMTLRLRSKPFRRWLARAFWSAHHKAPRSESMSAALGVLEGKAHYEGDERAVGLRVAGHADKVLLDLCDDDWRIVEVSANGWKIIPAREAPVRFERRRGMRALPTPARGGSLDLLAELVNVQPHEWPLLLGWLIGALRPEGPYPVLELTGEQGSAKSTLARLLRALLDPNDAPLRSEPKDPRDVAISAANSWVAALDNVSALRPWLSDALCRLATGGGLATRELYTDADEAIFDFTRPVILTGIEGVADRSDLADRTLTLTLEPIDAAKRKTERALWRRFEQVRPKILGALLDAVACALARHDKVTLAETPRLADWAQWATAAEPALGLADGDVCAAFSVNRAAARTTTIEAAAIGPVLVELAEQAGAAGWRGTFSDLLDALGERAGEKRIKARAWPTNARALAGQLRRLAPDLRGVGVEVYFPPSGGRKGGRIVRVQAWGNGS